ncbi:MAG: TIGR00725 family protein [Asgard group archaeon]|nr:TIGR00725 family protein [Asgard group archaeon]
MTRKKIIGVIGGGGEATCTKEDLTIAYKIGQLLIENNYRIINGGLFGVMEAVCKGARESNMYTDGNIIGVIPSLEKEQANDYCDIVIASGISYARNQIIVASADAIVAIGGGSGTLSEIAFAWQLNKPIFAVKTKQGWSAKLAGSRIDDKRSDIVIEVSTPEDLISKLESFFESKV